MELKGVIEKIFDTQVVGSNGFQKREFVVETQDKYPQHIKFEMTQERCKILDEFNTGDYVMVSFDVKGREYNGKYFINLQSWKLVRETEGSPSTTATTVASGSGDANLGSGSDDDLPF